MAGKSNYDAEKQSRRGNRCLDGWRNGGGGRWAERRPSPRAPPLPSLDTIQSEQSRAAWRYQPFHQPLNARPCLLASTHTSADALSHWRRAARKARREKQQLGLTSSETKQM